jgi:sulfotransferase family protein
MSRPDFFIVGAPRCGTTAMYEYLRRHPQVFMPEHKEPMYFGADLTQLHSRLTEPDYVGLFKHARGGQRVGEASTWYLYSQAAAREIHEFAPDGQIIIMLRNPVDVMYSLHRELVFYRGEVLEDFEEALAAEGDRKQGRRLGPSRRPEALYYRDTVRFADQVERYLTEFGPSRVKFVIFDDFVRNPGDSYADVLRFLNVDDTFRPEFERVNESKRPISPGLQALVVRPPRPLARLIPVLRRSRLAHQVRAALLSANSRSVERPPMSIGLRRRLTEDVAQEVMRLGELIGRDLSRWLPAEEERPEAATVA